MGQKGERGEPGLVITRTEGESHALGEIQIREICRDVVRGKLNKILISNLFRNCSIQLLIFYCFVFIDI